jgi:hypothetical protein
VAEVFRHTGSLRASDWRVAGEEEINAVRKLAKLPGLSLRLERFGLGPRAIKNSVSSSGTDLEA